MIGSNAGVTDRAAEGAGEVDVLDSPGLTDNRRCGTLIDAADVVSGSGVARPPIATGGTSDAREGDSEGHTATCSLSGASTSSTRSIAQGVSPLGVALSVSPGSMSS